LPLLPLLVLRLSELLAAAPPNGAGVAVDTKGEPKDAPNPAGVAGLDWPKSPPAGTRRDQRLSQLSTVA
jgi:hypothetical protein